MVLWAHTDAAKKHWNLPELAEAYGMKDRMVLTNTDLSDEQMAEAHCATNLTLGIGLGEGWGLVESSSLACGVPVLTADYAGATEFVPEEFRVKPIAFYEEGWYSHRRPVFDASDWADKIQRIISYPGAFNSSLRLEFTWDGCWPAWREWLLRGVTG